MSAPPAPSPRTRSRLIGVACALGAALLWGGSLPFSKRAADAGVAPLTAAALLYGGAALGLLPWLLHQRRRAARRGGPPALRPTRRDGAWIVASALVGAVLAPTLLIWGQARTTGLTSALLVAVEPPATALLAVALFAERLSRRALGGAALATAGAMAVALGTGGAAGATLGGALAVTGAAVGWALDNNLTTRVARLDPAWVAAVKGALGALASLALAAAMSQLGAPPLEAVATLLVAGFVGYGVGLSLIVRAFRELGAARTGALFATAPLFGALMAVVVNGDRPVGAHAVGAALLAAGVLVLVREQTRDESVVASSR